MRFPRPPVFRPLSLFWMVACGVSAIAQPMPDMPPPPPGIVAIPLPPTSASDDLPPPPPPPPFDAAPGDMPPPPPDDGGRPPLFPDGLPIGDPEAVSQEPLEQLSLEEIERRRIDYERQQAEMRAVRALNARTEAEQAARRRIEQARRERYNAEVRASLQAQQDYDARMREDEARYRDVMDGWRARVAACEGGDRTQCVPPPPRRP